MWLTTVDCRGRIRNLESLVVNLIQQKEQESASGAVEPVTSDNPEVSAAKATNELSPETFGQLHISNSGNETSYVGAGHWSSILKEIEDAKNSLEEEEEEDGQEEVWNPTAARSAITFGVPTPITKAQLIESMPPKQEVDHLLRLWFSR